MRTHASRPAPFARPPPGYGPRRGISNFNLVVGGCVRCAVPRCTSCSWNATKCDSCVNGYSLVNNTCVKVKVSGTGACSHCPPFQSKQASGPHLRPDQHGQPMRASGTLLVCSRSLQCPSGCGFCTSPLRCGLNGCLSGHFDDRKGGCVLCIVPNCSVCYNKTICYSCNDGFVAVNGTCVAVSIAAAPQLKQQRLCFW